MREILFRGKQEGNGEWVFGYPIYDSADCTAKRKGKCVCNHNGELVDFIAWIDQQHEYGSVKINPSTVGQYTGLTDNNGRKIFEGDIILYHHNVKKLVPCEDATQEEIQHYGLDLVTGLGLAYRPTKTIRYKGYVTIDNLWGANINLTNNYNWWLCEKNGQLTSVEIIGNIYDNPELLGRMVKQNG